MPDVRYALKHRDPTSTGGFLIATSHDFFHHGTPVGCEGDIATCPACNSQGPVFNDCHPFFVLHDKQILVSGARVHCQCANKPFVIHTQTDFTIEVGWVKETAAARTSFAGAARTDASNKLSGNSPAKATAAGSTRICANMSDTEFYTTMTRLRERATRLMSDRLLELERWSAADKDKVALWFGNSGEGTRELLQGGLARMREIARGLADRNFEKHTPEGLARVGCVPRARLGENEATASICKPDGTYTIFVGPKFCQMDEEAIDTMSRLTLDKDSKLLVLVHELSHFPGAMNAEDHQYSVRQSQLAAKMGRDFCINNADSIAAYVLDIPNWRGQAPTWKP